jgi:hypothetical protein
MRVRSKMHKLILSAGFCKTFMLTPDMTPIGAFLDLSSQYEPDESKINQTMISNCSKKYDIFSIIKLW